MLDIDERQRGPFVTDLLHMLKSNTVADYPMQEIHYVSSGRAQGGLRLVRKEAEMKQERS